MKNKFVSFCSSWSKRLVFWPRGRVIRQVSSVRSRSTTRQKLAVFFHCTVNKCKWEKPVNVSWYCKCWRKNMAWRVLRISNSSLSSFLSEQTWTWTRMKDFWYHYFQNNPYLSTQIYFSINVLMWHTTHFLIMEGCQSNRKFAYLNTTLQRNPSDVEISKIHLNFEGKFFTT